MREDGLAAIEGLSTAVGLQDTDAAMAYFAENAVFVLHGEHGLLGLGGEYRGKGEIRQLFARIRCDWEVVSWRSGPWLQRDDVYCGQATVCYRHRESGEELVTTKRQLLQAIGSKVSRFEESLDDGKWRAFHRYIHWRRHNDQN